MNYLELKEKGSELGIEITEDMISKLKKYYELLSEWNKKMNLTAITEEEEVIEKHFYDCILPLVHLKNEGKLADVGSGAGFPGIVFKIIKPKLNITLIEPSNKRCQFLKEVIKELNLKDIEVITERSEDYVKDNREVFDVVTARAVANLNILSELCIPLIKKEGTFLAMKGLKGIEESKEAEGAIEKLGCKIELIQENELPTSGKRINLFYKKVSTTQNKYPRPYSAIKKNPLV